jgi:hypothetical protein
VFEQFGYTQLTHTKLSPEQRWEIQLASFQAKMVQEATAVTGGIFERSLLDHYMYCLLYCHEVIPESDHRIMLQQVKYNLDSYDIIYFFPIYAWPQPEDDFRDASIANRELQDFILRGYISKYGWVELDNKMWKLPNISLEQRVQYLKADVLLFKKFGNHFGVEGREIIIPRGSPWD